MGVIRVTSRPYYYAKLEEQQRNMPPPEYPTGTLSFRFSVGGLGDDITYQQRYLRDIISSAFKEKGQYIRKHIEFGGYPYYEWDKIMVSGNLISTGRFDLSQLEPMLELLKMLDEKGLYPDDYIRIVFYPEKTDKALLMNMINIFESRRTLIEQALQLEEPFLLHLAFGLGLSIKLSSFSYTAIEAAAFLTGQAFKMAESTGKSRMKPCDMTNPKFQMRSWLLRLGFIGEQFERPRRTLLAALDGDIAFFSEEQKERAVARRKAKKMNGAVNCETA